MDLEEQILVDKFLKGDDRAYALIYKKYAKVLFSYGLGFISDKDILKDTIQDVFYKILINKELLSNVKNLKFFFLCSFKNRLIDVCRRNAKQVAIENYESEFTIQFNTLDGIIEKEDAEIVQQKIDKLMSCLTDRQREAVFLRFIQEMDYDEIATLLDMSPHSAVNLVSRAVLRMREQGVPMLLLLSTVRHYMN